MEEQIRANAELVRNVARDSLGVAVAYDEAGVRWLDQYIDGLRDTAEDDVKAKLPSRLGSYLGECVRQTFGGEWRNDPENGWMVRVNEKLSVYPFNKVRKQLNSADGESVLAFFKAIPALMKGMPKREPPKKPWWKVW